VSFAAPAWNGGAIITSYRVVINGSVSDFSASVAGSIVVSSLTNGQAYALSVVAINVAGRSVASSPVVVVTPLTKPVAPVIVSVSNYQNTQVSVTYSLSTNNGGFAIVKYTASAVPSAAGVASGAVTVRQDSVSGSATSIVLSGLVNGVTYGIRVTASNGIYTSDASVGVLATPATVASAPSNVQATSYENRRSTVSFNVPSSNGGADITSYTVIVTPGDIRVTGASSPIVVSGLTNGQNYTFSVYASNAAGNSSLSLASGIAVPATVPTAPTNVQASSYENQRSTVSFNIPSDNGGLSIVSYRVTALWSGGSIGVNGTGSSIVVNGLTNGQNYTFSVTATNTIGYTSSASVASGIAVPATVPTAVTNVQATNYEDQRSTVSFSVPSDNGGLSIVSYRVTALPDGIGVNGTGSPIVVSGLTNGKNYTFIVTATNTVGYTSSASVASAMIVPAGVPTVPTNVQATSYENGRSTVSFNASSNNNGAVVTSYTVTYYNPDLTRVSGIGSPIVVSGLSNGKNYTFTVYATNAAGNSSVSVASGIAVPATVPNVPTNVQATPYQNQSSIVSFGVPGDNGGASIAYYTVTASPGGQSATGIGCPIVVRGLTNGQNYSFTVTATNAAGTSLSSAASAVIVPATVPDAPTNVGATNYQNQSSLVNFTAPVWNGGVGILNYIVTSTPDNVSVNGTSSPITVNGLRNGQSYTFTVRACSVVGCSVASVSSASYVPATVPDVPVNVSATTYEDGRSGEFRCSCLEWWCHNYFLSCCDQWQCQRFQC